MADITSHTSWLIFSATPHDLPFQPYLLKLRRDIPTSPPWPTPSVDINLQMYDSRTGQLLKDLRPNRHGGYAVMCLRYHPKDPKLLYAGTAEGLMFLINTDTLECKQIINGNPLCVCVCVCVCVCARVCMCVCMCVCVCV